MDSPKRRRKRAIANLKRAGAIATDHDNGRSNTYTIIDTQVTSDRPRKTLEQNPRCRHWDLTTYRGRRNWTLPSAASCCDCGLNTSARSASHTSLGRQSRLYCGDGLRTGRVDLWTRLRTVSPNTITESMKPTCGVQQMDTRNTSSAQGNSTTPPLPPTPNTGRGETDLTAIEEELDRQRANAIDLVERTPPPFRKHAQQILSDRGYAPTTSQR